MIVVQKDKYGCFIACIAMVTGKSYDEIKSMFPFDINENRGADEFTQRSLLFELGYISQTFYETIAHTQKKREWPMKPFASWHIVSVITKANTPHVVFMDKNGLLIDPLDGDCKSFEDYSKINHIIAIWKKP